MARRLHEQALVDIASARENMRPRRYHNAAFFAEQAAEKALKAAHWHLLAEEPGWTHLMGKIAAAVGEAVGGIPQDISDAIAALLAIFETTRYPSTDVNEPIPPDLITETDATVAVEHAEKVLTWVESLLQLPTGRPRPKKN